MAKKIYQILTGDILEIKANSQAEAQEKFEAYTSYKACPCKKHNCNCVKFGEAHSLILNEDEEGQK